MIASGADSSIPLIRSSLRLSSSSARRRSATRAASTNEAKATLALKTCRVTIFWVRLTFANGPVALTADQMAMLDVTRAAGAAPRCPNRHAAQPRSGKTRYSKRRRE